MTPRSSPSTLASARPPFSMVPVSLVRSPDLSDRAVRLWALLDSHVDHRPGADATAWPGRKRLAEMLSCSLDSVDRTVRELEAAGWITVDRQAGKSRTNLYRLRIVQSARARTKDPEMAAPARPSIAAPARPELEPVEQDPETKPAKAAPTRTPRKNEEASRELARTVWEAKDPRPATPFVAVAKCAEALLDAGHAPGRVASALDAVPTISVRWCEGWLNKNRARSSSVERPNRQAASGRVKI